MICFVNLINLEDYKVQDSQDIKDPKYYDLPLYDVSLYPDRKFDGRVHVLLWKSESYGNIEYLEYFKKMDEANIEVVVYCVTVLLPIASLIGHRLILEDTLISEEMYTKIQVGTFMLNRKRMFRYAQTHLRLSNYWDSAAAHKDLEATKHTWEINKLYLFFRDRPIYMSQGAYDNWKSGVRGEFDPTKIHCEIKWRKYPKVTEYLESRDDCIGVKKEFQKRIIEQHNGDQNYLSYQILSSLDLGCRYIAIAGAASLLSLALPVNVIFASDHLNNVTEHIYYLKGLYNYERYNWATVGFMHNRFEEITFKGKHYNPDESPPINGWSLEEDWRMMVLKHCLDNAPIVTQGKIDIK